MAVQERNVNPGSLGIPKVTRPTFANSHIQVLTPPVRSCRSSSSFDTELFLPEVQRPAVVSFLVK